MDDHALRIQELTERAAMELVHHDDMDAIAAILAEAGYTASDLTRAVLLVPSAFARELFEPEGITFPEVFHVPLDGELMTRSYVDEPIYVEARALARRWMAESRPSLVQRVVDWSSEAKSIREARGRGLTPTSVGLVTHEF